MAHINHFNTNIALKPTPVHGTRVGIAYGPDALANLGFNLYTEVSTAGALVAKQESISSNSISVIGHLDTGSTRTSIDASLATHLELTSVGSSSSRTAAGLQETPDYTVNLSFIGYGLRQIHDLKVGSCNLGFDLTEAQANPMNVRNMGLLIGRDVMSLWNITWHGPTSTVFISD